MVSTNYIARSERLQLRNLAPSDLNFLHELFSNQQAMEFFPSLRDLEQTRQWVEMSEKFYETFGHGKWLIELVNTNTPIGHCGLIPTDVDGVNEIELGYFLDPRHWGQGYATEAAKLCIEIAAKRFGYQRIVSAINPANTPSIAVAKRLGMIKEKTGLASVGTTSWHAEIYALTVPGIGTGYR